jgi:hypothetical protein
LRGRGIFQCQRRGDARSHFRNRLEKVARCVNQRWRGELPASPGIIRRRGAPLSNADRAEFGQPVLR